MCLCDFLSFSFLNETVIELNFETNQIWRKFGGSIQLLDRNNFKNNQAINRQNNGELTRVLVTRRFAERRTFLEPIINWDILEAIKINLIRAVGDYVARLRRLIEKIA